MCCVSLPNLPLAILYKDYCTALYYTVIRVFGRKYSSGGIDHLQ